MPKSRIVMPSLFQGWPMITGWMGLAPFGDLGGAHFFVLWAHNEVHSAFLSHQAARQTERVFFRGA